MCESPRPVPPVPRYRGSLTRLARPPKLPREVDFDDLFDGFDIGGRWSNRARRPLKLFFGLLGTGLSGAGIWQTLRYDATLPFRLAGALLFVSLGAFFLFNVALGRGWSWPWKGFVAAFVLLFLVRILFGA
jgi:hypothetical protein